MSELKPCPFCGGWAHAAHHRSRNKDDEYYLVMCSACFARTVGESVDEAIAAWNRRATARWIPVRERLPEYNQNDTAKAYWVAYDTKDGKQMRIALYSDYMYSTVTGVPPRITWRDYSSHEIKGVTHWMPLPEPPEQEEQPWHTILTQPLI